MDDKFIEVNIANNALVSDVTTLHNFNEMDTHFSSFLQEQSGLQYDTTPTQSDPTLVMNKKTAFLGTQMDEYTITTMYIVRKIHASNRIPQASQSDLELILEHSRNGDNPNRLFLCIIISPENAMDPTGEEEEEQKEEKKPIKYTEMNGYDPAFVEFVSKIDTSSTSSAQFRINNRRKLPTSLTLSFPGITECLEYTDSEKNVVLLATTPLLIPETALQSLAAQISPDSAPVFSNFDLIPDSSAGIKLGKFLSNRVSTGLDKIVNPFEDVALEDDPKLDETDGFTGVIEANTSNKKATTKAKAKATTNAKGKSNSKKEAERAAATKRANDAIFALHTLTVAMVVVPLCVVIWIYFPYMYSEGLKHFGGVNETGNTLDRPSDSVLSTRLLFTLYLGISFALLITGASIQQWVVMIIGLVLIVLWITAIAAIRYDLNLSNGVIINKEKIQPFYMWHGNYK